LPKAKTDQFGIRIRECGVTTIRLSIVIRAPDGLTSSSAIYEIVRDWNTHQHLLEIVMQIKSHITPVHLKDVDKIKKKNPRQDTSATTSQKYNYTTIVKR
jgi:hypothetical protein